MSGARHDGGAASPEICLVATVPYSLAVFMTPHIRTLAEKYRVTLVANAAGGAGVAALGTSVSFRALPASVRFQHLDISRGVSGFADVRALIGLYRLFRRHRYAVVQSITPKAGLLSMLAARWAGVPVRIHWFTGQVWATRSGWSRWMLRSMDRLLVKCATHVLADSPSQRDFLAREGVAPAARVVVLGQGSVCGVDTARFRPSADARARIRGALGIPSAEVAALFLGRLNRDKGLPELVEAYTVAARHCRDLHLVIVGADEQGARAAMQRPLADVVSRVHFVDYTDEPEAYMAAADIFVLPSRREGFGSSVIEAAACEVPAIGSSIYGLVDAIADGESGILVPTGDAAALADALIRLATDRPTRLSMGQAARRRVERYFKESQLTAALMDFYAGLELPEGPGA